MEKNTHQKAKGQGGRLLRFSRGPVLDPFQLSGKTALALLEELMATAALVSRDGG